MCLPGNTCSSGNELGELFQVDEISGTLTVLEPLDREAQDTYIIGVRAMDSASVNPLFTVTEVGTAIDL